MKTVEERALLILKQVEKRKLINNKMLAKHLNITNQRVTNVFRAKDIKLTTLIKFCDAAGLDLIVTVKTKSNFEKINLSEDLE